MMVYGRYTNIYPASFARFIKQNEENELIRSIVQRTSAMRVALETESGLSGRVS